MRVVTRHGVALLFAVPMAAAEVDFLREIQPMLASKCGACHSGAKPQARLAVHTRDELLKGGVTGPAIVPGNSAGSALVQRVAGLKGLRMPPVGDPLSAEQIATLRAWIDQGAKVDTVAPSYPVAALALREPNLPQAPPPWSANPVDRFVYANRQLGNATVSDALFARRVYLDVWGLLPPPAELTAFEADASPEKRAQLVDRLLADKRRYAEHWISFWNDLLRNDEGVIYHGGRKSITPWLLASLESNKPYNVFVSELLNPTPESEGFLVGVNWRGDVSASQTPPMQAAMNAAQVFLGANLKCAACHDSFVSRWKLRQTYGLAAFFADGPMKLVRCDVELDEMAKVAFLFPDLEGGAAQDATLAERRKAVARLFTTEANGRFPRTLVNRLWRQLFGRGIVEPVDDLDNEPWNRDLLDWLASDFVKNGYDIQHTLRLLMTSRVYQLPATPAAEESSAYVFRGPELRRLSAEQFLDGIAQVTGEWRVLTPRTGAAGSYAREWRFKSSPLTRALGRPIRDQVYTERTTRPTTLQALELVNGRDLSRTLARGARRMLDALPRAPKPLLDSGNLGNGAAKSLPLVQLGDARKLWLLLEDMESYDPKRVVAGWTDATLRRADGSTVPLSSLRADREFTLRPIQTRDRIIDGAITAGFPSQLVFDIDAQGFIALELGVAVENHPSAVGILPNVRFFVFTGEPVRDELVPVEGAPPVADSVFAKQPAALIDGVWRQAYGRAPSVAEKQAASRFLGPKPTPEGLEDLLWSVFLSPEYQFIQ